MLPLLKRKLFKLHYTCTAVAAVQRNIPPDHLCQEDFRYKESVEFFVEPSALIPLLGHQEGAAEGSSIFDLRTTLQLSWTTQSYPKS
ncbi:hypothetical protein A2U01_0014557 [Trifolium medium]|uniref:Uncharacterized protein n=1 Tax=Trifolium medium TaxID=97028 RepID=A0A392N394_9FABA|nr:hypothetical protein [Trifolium medium]